jgi:inhibitor of cysteine peptidase
LQQRVTSSVLFFALALLACAAETSDARLAPPQRLETISGAAIMGDVTLSTADDGRTIVVATGQKVLLSLPENPSTGYEWSLDVPDGVEVRRSGFTPGGTPRMGSGGEHLWELSAARPGEFAIAAKLWLPWQGDPSVRQPFRATLKVMPAGSN